MKRRLTIHVAALVSWLFLIPAADAQTTGALFQDDPVTARGFAADKVYQLGDLDHVNLFNGNLLLTIPIGPSYPVSSHLSYGLTLVYNGNLWDFEHWCDQGPPGDRCFTAAWPGPGFQAGMGWTLSMGRLLPPEVEFLNDSPQWVYVGSDGGRHRFWSTLHASETSSPNVSYSRDGSYLRMTAVGGLRKVQFPDGVVQTFRDLTASTNDEWVLTEVEDPYGNRVEIGYCAPPGACTKDSVVAGWTQWLIRDQHGREHTVEFTPTAFDNYPRQVDRVRLTAFDGTPAEYDFTYVEPELPRSCPQNVEQPGPLRLPLLERLTLPDGSEYGFEYFDAPPVGDACRGNSGRIQELTLPTGGKIGWTYRTYTYGQRENPLPPGNAQPPATTGVATRRLTSVSGQVWEWQYVPELTEHVLYGPLAFTVEVTAPSGARTANHFSISRCVSATGCSGDPDGFTEYDYGLPLRRDESDPIDGTMFLSSESFDAAGTRLRSTYVRYERDENGPLDGSGSLAAEHNRRLASQRTVYWDDLDGATPRWRETARSGFDGLGHYRVETRRGSFFVPGDQDEPLVSRTEHNPACGSYRVNAAGELLEGIDTGCAGFQSWILGTWTYRETRKLFQSAGLVESSIAEAADSIHRTYAVFDPATGFLECRRTLRDTTPDAGGEPSLGSRDVLVVFADGDGDGDVDGETIYGGDVGGLSTTDAGSCTAGTAAEYERAHAYEHGVRRRSAWVCGGADVLVTLDQDIDAATGLVSAGRDASGYLTSYSYDDLGRLTGVFPADEARTVYTYQKANPAAGTNARVDVTQLDGVVTLTSQRILFDDFGRVCREQEWMPDLTWNDRQRAYTAEGWPRETGEAVAGGAAAATACGFDPGDPLTGPKTVYSGYDPFGRVGQVVAADGGAVSFSYVGERATFRRITVAAPTGDRPSSTGEIYDSFGRLRRLREVDNDPGQEQITYYGYAPGGQLRAVEAGAQKRTRFYTGLGRVSEERQPELGPGAGGEGTHRVSYEYDSLGNVTRRRIRHITTDDTYLDLTYRYDRAGRLTQVRETGVGGRLLKELFYYPQDFADPAGERNRGKLYQAKRHNYGTPTLPLPVEGGEPDLAVTESYRYGGRGARVSERQTRLANGATAAVFDQSFAYDALGNLEEVGYPRCRHAPCAGLDEARTVISSYTLGRLTAVSGYASAISYHPNGLVHQIAHANGMTDTQTIAANAMARPRRISAAGGSSWDSGVYAYDPAGNIEAIGGDAYRYDLFGRIATATVSGQGQSFTYDRYGNLTAVAGAGARTLAVDAATNRLTAASYDERGNLLGHSLTGTAQVYGYDAFNMQKSAQTTAFGFGYLYTADDERLVEWDFSQDPWRLTWSLRGLDGKVLRQWVEASSPSEGTSSWQWSQDYVYRDGQLLAAERDGGETHHFHLDHLGTPRLITAADGSEVGRHTYFPFGDEVTDPAQDAERMKFTGHERDRHEVASGDEASAAAVPEDPDDDLDYMHARHYSPYLGRFLSVDPIESSSSGSPQSWNRYAYALDNPLKHIDPNGEETRIVLGLQTERNYFGHIAIAIDDRVFSYGTRWVSQGGDWGVSLEDYLQAQAGERESVLLRLDVNTEQEGQLLEILSESNPYESSAYDVLANSCVTVCESALEGAGILENEPGPLRIDQAGNLLQRGAPASITPRGLAQQVENQNLVVNTEKISGRKVSELRSALETLLEALGRVF